jgi:hypothetical protein
MTALVSSPKKAAIATAYPYKGSRRLWYRDLLSQLDVDDPDTLATQLALLVDGAYAAVLIHRDPAMMRPAIGAARTLLKATGVAISTAEAKSVAIGRAPGSMDTIPNSGVVTEPSDGT